MLETTKEERYEEDPGVLGRAVQREVDLRMDRRVIEANECMNEKRE